MTPTWQHTCMNMTCMDVDMAHRFRWHADDVRRTRVALAGSPPPALVRSSGPPVSSRDSRPVSFASRLALALAPRGRAASSRRDVVTYTPAFIFNRTHVGSQLPCTLQRSRRTCTEGAGPSRLPVPQRRRSQDSSVKVKLSQGSRATSLSRPGPQRKPAKHEAVPWAQCQWHAPPREKSAVRLYTYTYT
jgi:hypothetical protein